MFYVILLVLDKQNARACVCTHVRACAHVCMHVRVRVCPTGPQFPGGKGRVVLVSFPPVPTTTPTCNYSAQNSGTPRVSQRL